MNALDLIVNFFKQGGAFLYPIAAVFAIGVGVAIERFIYLSRVSAGNRRLWARARAAHPGGQLPQGDGDRRSQGLGALDHHEVRHLAHGERAAPRGHREGDGGEPDRGHPARREAHALPRHARQHRHADGPARHRHRPDQRVRSGGERQPGREGEPAVRQHLGGDEQHGARPRARDHAAALPHVPRDQDDRARRQPRGRLDQVPELGERASRRRAATALAVAGGCADGASADPGRRAHEIVLVACATADPQSRTVSRSQRPEHRADAGRDGDPHVLPDLHGGLLAHQHPRGAPAGAGRALEARAGDARARGDPAA